MADSPKVSVVVTSLNAGESIADRLGALASQDYGNLEIILVDAGSSDKTAELARKVVGQRDNFRLLVDKRATTPAKGRNIGARVATGERLAFTNSDCVPEPDWVSTLVRWENWREDTGGVGGKTLFTKIPEGQRMLRALHEAIGTRLGSGGSAQFFDYKTQRNVRSLPSCNVMYRTDLFARLGGFEESLRYCEDSYLNIWSCLSSFQGLIGDFGFPLPWQHSHYLGSSCRW